jgi:CRP-like cAMP-binding protein
MTQGEDHHRLLVLIEGGVEVLKDGVRVARCREPGAVFGELSILLDVPHTATVRTTEPSSFFVMDDPKEFLRDNPGAALQLCRMLARRIDSLNGYLVDIKQQFQEQEGHMSMIGDVLDTLMHHQPRAWPKDAS